MIGKCYPRHRAIEFRRFLDEIEAAVPAYLDVHMVIDNCATHKAPLIRNWLARRPRWHWQLTPTSSSWLDQVERFVTLLAECQLRRGIHRSVVALKTTVASLYLHKQDRDYRKIVLDPDIPYRSDSSTEQDYLRRHKNSYPCIDQEIGLR